MSYADSISNGAYRAGGNHGQDDPIRDSMFLADSLVRKATDMGFANWVKSCFTRRGKSMALYRSGMAKANKCEYSGAIADYSAAIDAPHVPADVKAMALYNRALAYSAMHEDAKAASDLAAVLAMPHLSENVRTAAQQRRERIRRRSEKTNGS